MACVPQIPQYAQNPPAINTKCGNGTCGGAINTILPPLSGGDGKTTELFEGFSIDIMDLSDVNVDRFEIAYDPYEAVAVALSIIAKALTVIKTNPILAGTIIDAVECDWSYNAVRDGDINAQTLVNSGAGVDPTLIGTDRDYDYSGLTIIDDQTVTIDGTDGRSNDIDVANIIFGNYIAIGISDPSMLFQDPDTDTQAIFDNLASKIVNTSQEGVSFNAFGTDQEYMTIAHPASWGESEFTKGSFTGGYQRIYLVNRAGNNLFVNEVLGGDTPADIDIDNGNGHIEPYFFYQAEFPARTGEEPTIISKK